MDTSSSPSSSSYPSSAPYPKQSNTIHHHKSTALSVAILQFLRGAVLFIILGLGLAVFVYVRMLYVITVTPWQEWHLYHFLFASLLFHQLVRHLWWMPSRSVHGHIPMISNMRLWDWLVAEYFPVSVIFDHDSYQQQKQQQKQHIDGHHPSTRIPSNPDSIHHHHHHHHYHHQSIFGIHPHGAFPFGAMSLFIGNRARLQSVPLRILAADALLSLPLLGDLCIAWGAVSASRTVARRVLRQGYSLAVFVGGERESFSFDADGDIHLIVRPRTGFVRLALQHGVDLVPVFVFGQTDIYRQYKPLLYSWRRWLVCHLRCLFMFIWGIFLWVPFPRPMHVVVGRPIHVPCIAEPTADDIRQVQERYIQRLEDIYARYREQFHHSHRQLIIT